MIKKTYVFSCLMIVMLCAVGLVGCNKPEKEMAEKTPASGAPAWLLRGGDINRASLIKEWKSLDQEGRLAASADLVTMQLRNANQEIPSLAKLEALARSLESRLTEISAGGTRDEDYVGDVVDDIWPSIQQ